MWLLSYSTLCYCYCSPFGSHVADKIFIRLSSLYDRMTQEEYDSLNNVSG
jgi:hypothetical protein